jgi:hypothetical protein
MPVTASNQMIGGRYGAYKHNPQQGQNPSVLLSCGNFELSLYSNQSLKANIKVDHLSKNSKSTLSQYDALENFKAKQKGRWSNENKNSTRNTRVLKKRHTRP